MNTGKVDVLLGLQWGDEGKGKVVDVLTPKYDVIARFQGGPNAGHTLEFEGQSMCFAPSHQVFFRVARKTSLVMVWYWLQTFSCRRPRILRRAVTT